MPRQRREPPRRLLAARSGCQRRRRNTRRKAMPCDPTATVMPCQRRLGGREPVAHRPTRGPERRTAKRKTDARRSDNAAGPKAKARDLTAPRFSSCVGVEDLDRRPQRIVAEAKPCVGYLRVFRENSRDHHREGNISVPRQGVSPAARKAEAGKGQSGSAPDRRVSRPTTRTTPSRESVQETATATNRNGEYHVDAATTRRDRE